MSIPRDGIKCPLQSAFKGHLIQLKQVYDQRDKEHAIIKIITIEMKGHFVTNACQLIYEIDKVSQTEKHGMRLHFFPNALHAFVECNKNKEATHTRD